jgi:hypothetical protein
LKPAVTIAHRQPEGITDDFEINLAGQTGEIVVDWGDGIVQKFMLDNTQPGLFLRHHYEAGSKKYVISITGALNQITGLSFISSIILENIIVNHLPELTDFSLGNAILDSPRKINLAHNTKLQFLQILGTDVSVLELPLENHLRDIQLSGSKNLSPANMDDIINKVYSNAKAHNETNGTFLLSESFFDDSEVMIGPPSASGIDKLRKLRDNFHWIVSPDPS